MILKKNTSAIIKVLGCIFIIICLPCVTYAQVIADEISSMQTVLNKAYGDLLPMCSKLIDVARSIGAFGALWYIASRAWKQIATAQPIDFYPLLRPFAIGMLITSWPLVITVMNGVLEPTVTGTDEMFQDSKVSIKVLLRIKEEFLKHTNDWQMYVGVSGEGNYNHWYKYTQSKKPSIIKDALGTVIGEDMKFILEKQMYNFRNSIKQWLSELLEIVYASASLCINTLRTFILLVLAIVGPLVFGFSIFDGFQSSLSQWLARYVNTFLWLPVASIFGTLIGKIQANMIKLDIDQLAHSLKPSFSSTDPAYLVFLIIGIVGYFYVPTVAGYIVHAQGGNNMISRVSGLLTSTAVNTISVASAGAGRVVQGAGNLVKAPLHFAEGYSGGPGQGGSSSGYMHNKISGKPDSV